MRIEIVANENRQTEISFEDVKTYLSECIGVAIQPNYIEKGLNSVYTVEYDADDALYLDESGANFVRDGDRFVIPASLGLNNLGVLNMTEILIHTEMDKLRQINQDEYDACAVVDAEIKILKHKVDMAMAIRNEIAEPFAQPKEEQELVIKTLMLDIGKTVKNEFGSVSFRKGSIRTSWDSKALEGYAAGGHDEILQFKKETEVKPSVTIKMGDSQ